MRGYHKNHGKFLKRLLVLLTAALLFASACALVGCDSPSKNNNDEPWSGYY